MSRILALAVALSFALPVAAAQAGTYHVYTCAVAGKTWANGAWKNTPVSCVVADTNLLVSALPFGGKPRQLLDLATDGQVDLAISEAIIAETLRVSGTSSTARLSGLLRPTGSCVSSPGSSSRPRASRRSKLTLPTTGFSSARLLQKQR